VEANQSKQRSMSEKTHGWNFFFCFFAMAFPVWDFRSIGGQSSAGDNQPCPESAFEKTQSGVQRKLILPTPLRPEDAYSLAGHHIEA